MSYKTVTGYFVQDNHSPDTLPPILRRFGLLEGKTWADVTNSLNSLNASADSKTSYILFFLARHGQGYHNEGAEKHHNDDWSEKWSSQDGDGKICWGPDAYLTHHGEDQAGKARDAWKGERPFGIPLPDKMYCSPLTRALRTHEITFAHLIPATKTVVLENCREGYGKHTPNKRRTKSYISLAFPSYEIESGFKEEDELWTPDSPESHIHVQQRARGVLKTVFGDEDKPQVVAITAHGGFIRAFLDVIKHPMTTGDLHTGAVFPVIVKCTKTNNADVHGNFHHNDNDDA